MENMNFSKLPARGIVGSNRNVILIALISE